MSIEDLVSWIGIIGALGTAAYGLVDSSKLIVGGISRAGFGYIRNAVSPFVGVGGATGTAFGPAQIIETLRANWMNGMAKADQKAAARSLIRLMLTPGDPARRLAALAGVNADHLASAAQKIYDGTALADNEIKAIGAFDVAVAATLDLGYERGDQFYRNSAKVAAAGVAIVLSLVAWRYGGMTVSWQMALMVGLIATPLAPMAKDISSALQTAAKAVSIARR